METKLKNGETVSHKYAIWNKDQLVPALTKKTNNKKVNECLRELKFVTTQEDELGLKYYIHNDDLGRG